MRAKLRLIPLLIWAALLAAGCGYQISGTPGNDSYAGRTLFRDDVKTVAVPIFANKTYFQGVEFALSKALENQIESKSPYKVVPRDRADTLLEGEVTNIRVRTISNDRVSAVPQEQLYIVSVDFRWKDLRTGKILVQRRDFEQTAPWYPTLGEGQFYGNQQNIERLALAIVDELQADWGTR